MLARGAFDHWDDGACCDRKANAFRKPVKYLPIRWTAETNPGTQLVPMQRATREVALRELRQFLEVQTSYELPPKQKVKRQNA
jgi:hypothetical protein